MSKVNRGKVFVRDSSYSNELTIKEVSWWGTWVTRMLVVWGKGEFEVGKGWNDILILHKGGRGACQKESLGTKMYLDTGNS